VAYLKKAPRAKGLNITEGDFLKTPAAEIFHGEHTAVIGNYPYNISTEIAFKAMDNVQHVSFFGGRFQREVARRFCSIHGNKEYGVTSVLLQALYDCKYEFTVPADAFVPAPKVTSGVIACHRKAEPMACTTRSLKLVVKTAFNQRRKTLNNALKPLTSSRPAFVLPETWGEKRAEQLSVADFISLALNWESST
jgi:16S rRNA (adenine1518-N6/adenine1519-N6)-dimethyltransferase